MEKKTPVLVLGLPRTGTSSIKEAFVELGYQNVYHMITVLRDFPQHAPLWNELMLRKFKDQKPVDPTALERLINGYEVISDYPASAFSPELIDLYPDAKVILTVRDAEGWIKSCKNTFVYFLEHRGLADFVAYVSPGYSRLWSMLLTVATVVMPWGGREDGTEFFHRHNATVRQCMASKPEQFLEFDVRQGWGPLCSFLEKPIPSKPFPNVNDTATLRRRSKMIQVIYLVKEASKYTLAAGVVYAAWRWARPFLFNEMSIKS